MAKIKLTPEERADRTALLIDRLTGVTTVYTVVRKVAASGMRREISLLVVKDGRILDITWGACAALGEPLNKEGDAIIVRGCGMNMAWWLVDRLATTLGLPLTHQML